MHSLYFFGGDIPYGWLVGQNMCRFQWFQIALVKPVPLVKYTPPVSCPFAPDQLHPSSKVTQHNPSIKQKTNGYWTKTSYQAAHMKLGASFPIPPSIHLRNLSLSPNPPKESKIYTDIIYTIYAINLRNATKKATLPHCLKGPRQNWEVPLASCLGQTPPMPPAPQPKEWQEICTKCLHQFVTLTTWLVYLPAYMNGWNFKLLLNVGYIMVI